MPARTTSGRPRPVVPYVIRTMRLSVAVVRYAYSRWSVAYRGESASPSRPPSPLCSTPGTVPTTRFVAAPTSRTQPVSRSPTRACPSGRNAIPHGVVMPVATVPSTRTLPVAGGVGMAPEVALEDVPEDAGGAGDALDPEEVEPPSHAASARAAATPTASSVAVGRARRRVMLPIVAVAGL